MKRYLFTIRKNSIDSEFIYECTSGMLKAKQYASMLLADNFQNIESVKYKKI